MDVAKETVRRLKEFTQRLERGEVRLGIAAMTLAGMVGCQDDSREKVSSSNDESPYAIVWLDRDCNGNLYRTKIVDK